METCNILLVKDGPQDPFDAIGQRLALDPNVTLASEAPVSVEQAVVMIWEQPEIAVILIIGQETAIPAIASAIRAARSDVHMLRPQRRLRARRPFPQQLRRRTVAGGA
ncbi:hypothetical protein HH800_16585 [Sphingobium yanoikuyae]|uniref:Response regulatory domain-containing protein n=1 Tax=Sphingobium yanoikuyae TaxID=13690 RepID=A0A6M4G9J5_SPHYA|nr:hypothetical protein [Sphingobium yanoikuyae]QJR03656.1 hypothetical protein HH800_16585 [Sphingobium yanoikuyae]